MKSFSVIFFSLYIFIAAIIPNYDVEELGKISHLIEHYNEHKTSHSKISVLDFILSHINISNQNDSEHSKLPFQNHQLPNFFPVIVSNYTVTIFFNLNHTVINHYFDYNTSSTNAPSKSVWQPPRA